MRNLFYFLPVLTTRAGVNKYGVPQIGGFGFYDPDIRCSIADKQIDVTVVSLFHILYCRLTDQSWKRASLLHLFSLRAATSRWGQETMFYIADNTKQIKGYPRGEGFHIFYCRQTDRDQLWIWELQLFLLRKQPLLSRAS